MPYRRLPNTDKARIKALKTAINNYSFGNSVISIKSINEAKKIYNTFVLKHKEYIYAYEKQIEHSKILKDKSKKAKLYISHFIQILNMSVQRKEIKKEIKKYYNLETDDYNIPDLTSDKAIEKIGKEIIAGEKKRLSEGGTPLYNPPIAKVKVFYDIFRECFISHKIFISATERTLNNLSNLRKDIDYIILEIWNEIENHFSNLPTEEKIEKCKKYGVIYYYRNKEKND